MINIPQNQLSEEEVLNFYKQNYKTKFCSEVTFEATIPEKYLKPYQKFKNSSCCLKPLSLLIYCIFILIIACAGFYFSIGENKGYKAYKGVLERNMSLIDNSFPHEHETVKLVKYLTTEYDAAYACPYIKYSLDICTLYDYRRYCPSERYAERLCNYMDRQYNLGLSFECNLANFQSGYCDQIQYNDYLEKTQGITYTPKITYLGEIKISLQSFSMEKIWCKIGDYDRPIILSFIIILLIFIIFLIFDLATKKKTLTSGVKYYIIVSVYMLYYVLLRIYAILIFILLFYGVFVSFLHPTTVHDDDGTIRDPFFGGGEIYFPEEKEWKDKRIYGFIFCGICLALFIMVLILCHYKKLIYNYLSFNFDEKNEININNNNNNITQNNEIEILRKASIKVGKFSCDFEIKQNKDLYLMERRSKLKYHFKEIVYQNETYFLKCNNLGLKDQLAWNEFKYPNINEVFMKLSKMLIYNIIISFFILFFYIWKLENDVTYDYYLHLIDLGFKPKKYKYLQKCDDLNEAIFNYIAYIYLILGIFIMLSIAKIVYFGGFKNMIFIWISILIVIIMAIINLIAMVLFVVGCAYNLISFLNFPDKDIKFEGDNLSVKLMMPYFYYIYNFIFSMSLFIASLGLISPLNRIKRENQKLSIENKTSEDIFKYITFENTFWVLEAVNNNNIPKHLFYTRKINSDNLFQPEPPKSALSDKIICLEMNTEEILEDKEKALLQAYKYKEFDTKRIISRIILQIIYGGISAILLIVILCLSFNSNKYYKAYRDYILYYENHFTSYSGFDEILPTYVKFWCGIGDMEHDVLISLLIFIIIYIGFEVFSLLMHKIVINIDYNSGIFSRIILLANMAYYILFKIYLPLIVFLIIYTFVSIVYSPHDTFRQHDEIFGTSFRNNIENELNKEWSKKKYLIIVNFILKFIFVSFMSFLINVKYNIIEYLNKTYEESEDEEEQKNNKINVEKNEVTTSININNAEYDTRIKLNDILYLQEIDSENNGKKFKFKKLYIQNITSDFIYVRLGENSITDRISNSQWNYPDINYLFAKLGDMCDWIYMILFFSVPLFKLHVNNEITYYLIKLIHKGINISNAEKPLFADIFDKYESFEKGITESRFSLYIIQLVFIFALMLKRIYFGGFNNSCHLLIVFNIDIIFLIQNIIYIILDFLVILFSVFCIVCYYKNEYDRIGEDMLIAKFFLQAIINIDMFVNNINLLKENVTLTKYLNTLRKSMDRFIKREDNIDETMPNFKPVEFKYVTLDGNINAIKEFNNGMLQRFLFYTPENIENAQNVDNINDINTENKIKFNDGNEVVIHQNKKNYEQVEVKNDTIGIKINDDENNQNTEKKLN